jgi:hypothetical protein
MNCTGSNQPPGGERNSVSAIDIGIIPPGTSHFIALIARRSTIRSKSNFFIIFYPPISTPILPTKPFDYYKIVSFLQNRMRKNTDINEMAANRRALLYCPYKE